MVKKLISMLLVTVMLCTSVIIPVSATEEQTQTTDSTTTSIENDDLTVTGTNSFGNLLSDKIQESSSEMTDTGSRISDIQIEGTTATVTYSALEDCTILVGIFDETTDQLLASGKSKVSKNVQTAVITIETDAMPEYYKIKAYMLNGDNSPIATEYNSPLYTKEIQDLKKKTIHDFGDSEVLQLGEEEDTNFAVFKEGTKIIKYQEGYNIPELIDSENGKYVFSNASDEIMSLESGDAFSCTYSESDILLAVVDTIQISGTTVTITEKDAEIEDIFECVKIESGANLDDCIMDNSVAPDCVQPVASGRSRNEEDSIISLPEKIFQINFDPTAKDYEDKKDDEKVKFSGDIKLTARVTISSEIVSNLYITIPHTYIKLGFRCTNNLSLRTTGTGRVEVTLTKLQFPLGYGVEFTFTPVFILEASVSLNMDYTTEFYFGFSYDSDTDFQLESYSTPTESEASISGYALMGIKLKFGTELISDKILELNVSTTLGIRISGARKMSKNHLCTDCIGGSAELCMLTTGGGSVFNGLFSFTAPIIVVGGPDVDPIITAKLFDWYRSYDYNEFDFTTCPHIKSEQIVDIVTMANGYTSPNQEIYLFSSSNEPVLLKSNKNGMIRCSLEPGNYMLLKNTAQKTFQVKNNSMTVFFDFIKDKAKYSGQCGPNCYWALYDDGSLVIYGEGEMTDYSEPKKVPWYEMRETIKSITIFNGVTTIGDRAFDGCKNATDISIADSITRIGTYAFCDCASLNEVILPDKLETINDRAFYFCTNLTDISIPHKVTYIGSYAFSDCTNLVNALIYGYVDAIEPYTFLNCESLICCTIPDSVTNIKKGAFENCKSMATITIPDSVTQIGNDAFWSCEKLSHINLSNNLITIGDSTFLWCNLTSVSFPDSLKSIGDCAFSHCLGLTSVSIPDSVTFLGTSAFRNCKNMSKVYIGNGVRNIESQTFYECANLTNVILPNNLISIGYDAFMYCESLSNITIPDNVELIRGGAFKNCISLTSIDIPNSVSSIGGSAFKNCISLTSIDIPNSVSSIGGSAFENCKKLQTAIIGKGVTNIEDRAFYNCEMLEQITIPDSVSVINAETFYNCNNLSSVELGNGITGIGYQAFAYCGKLSNIIIPNKVTYIGQAAFIWCDKLLYIKLPNGLMYIDSFVFYCCKSLTNVTIPNSVTTLGQCAFRGCKNLESVTLSENIKRIEMSTFNGCENLTSIVIPSSVETIVTYAFTDCYNLESVTINGSPVIESQAFRCCPCEEEILEKYGATTSLSLEESETNSTTAVTSSLIGTATETTTEVTSETTVTSLTAEINNLTPNAFYFVVVVKSDSVEDLLTADNLLYFTQVTSDENGNISLSYVPRESCDAPVVLTYRSYVNNIEDADIEIKDMYYTGSEQIADYTISFNGKILEKDVDFTVSGDLSATETGWYSLTFTGINDYQGSVTKYYVLVDPYLYGDADMDGRITVKDSTFIQRYLVGLETESDEMILLSDTDGNGEVNILDATAIQQYLVDNDALSKYTGRCSILLK